jgi:hypothetical protein
MSYRTNSDNIYSVGILISAIDDPSLKLKIMTYYQRIYYCAVMGDEDRKQLAYYERELVPPVK